MISTFKTIANPMWFCINDNNSQWSKRNTRVSNVGRDVRFVYSFVKIGNTCRSSNAFKRFVYGFSPRTYYFNECIDSCIFCAEMFRCALFYGFIAFSLANGSSFKISLFRLFFGFSFMFVNYLMSRHVWWWSNVCSFKYTNTLLNMKKISLKMVKQHHQHHTLPIIFQISPFHLICSVGLVLVFFCFCFYFCFSLLLHHHIALNVIDSQKWRKISMKFPDSIWFFVSSYDMMLMWYYTYIHSWNRSMVFFIRLAVDGWRGISH